MPDNGAITASTPNIPVPTGGTTRTFGNMLNQKTRLNVPKKKKVAISGWSK